MLQNSLSSSWLNSYHCSCNSDSLIRWDWSGTLRGCEDHIRKECSSYWIASGFIGWTFLVENQGSIFRLISFGIRSQSLCSAWLLLICPKCGEDQIGSGQRSGGIRKDAIQVFVRFGN
ncbi:hypothetical protein NPIL_696231 [Nephila pilipes]|uniref:Uncharacterized protein n=1 Tax=Nephila pilipes TaxID=299642 RepID=A0A8X6JD88_NEPPI|nr:hypothetical protein NPIL_696231 [Nephila pilipes]